MTEVASPYIIAAIAAWAFAQGLKYCFALLKDRNVGAFRQLYLSGGMPSAHSATVVALMTVVGLRDGTGSALFGVVALLAAIVMYDAVMVRRSVGEQGSVIASLIDELKSKTLKPRAAKGHRPLEVLAGAVLGAAIGVVVFFATK